MTTVTFALLREGTSDDGLLVVLRELLVRAGASAAVGDSRPYRGDTEAKLRALLAEGVDLDVVFVHRDSDTRDPLPRHEEVASAAAALGCPPPIVIGVVPVRMTETWALCDPEAIRTVAGNPGSAVALDLPGVGALERMANTKRVLKDALATASETTGRRRQKFNTSFPTHRRTLLERIDVDGPVAGLTSFGRLRADIQAAVADLLRS